MWPWFSRKIIKWYQVNKRDLPWRDQNDPYFIWLSEIILQQTQVVQGLGYYNRFVKKYPTIKRLAAAHEDEVLKLWQGLGYYSRARNLHHAAITVANSFNGVFPDKYEDVRSLKGVGDYTAAAITSFAYNQPYAVVDGNVYRVLSRVFGIKTPIDSTSGKKEFQQLATELLEKKDSATYNQAIMEFGAQYCRPVNPDCDNCIFKEECVAFNSGSVFLLPVKTKKTKLRQRYLNYIIVVDKNKNMVINRRGKGDIWEGLYEFPLIETDKITSQEELFASSSFKKLSGDDFTILHSSAAFKHVLTHQHLFAKFYVIGVNRVFPQNDLTSDRKGLKKYALSRLTLKFLDDWDLKEMF